MWCAACVVDGWWVEGWRGEWDSRSVSPPHGYREGSSHAKSRRPPTRQSTDLPRGNPSAAVLPSRARSPPVRLNSPRTTPRPGRSTLAPEGGARVNSAVGAPVLGGLAAALPLSRQSPVLNLRHQEGGFGAGQGGGGAPACGFGVWIPSMSATRRACLVPPRGDKRHPRPGPPPGATQARTSSPNSLAWPRSPRRRRPAENRSVAGSALGAP